jgi:hypothetical protein
MVLHPHMDPGVHRPGLPQGWECRGNSRQDPCSGGEKIWGWIGKVSVVTVDG